MLVIVKDIYEEISQVRSPDHSRPAQEKATPLGLYKELLRKHQKEGLDFSKVTTFNLDEYVNLSPLHDQRYHYFMRQNLFHHVNIPEHGSKP